MKCFVILLFAFGFYSTYAQESFAELSAKQRISIAEREEAEAKSDMDFQKTMTEGHQLFKSKHYLKAIQKYEKAKSLRPYNVYPKVIIDDIELSMKDTLEVLRAAERERKTTPKLKEELPENNIPQIEIPEDTPEERIQKMNDWEIEEREKRKTERARIENTKPEKTLPNNSGRDVPILSLDDFQKDLAQKYPEGITETTEKEGNRKIITRVLVAGGKGNEYKKVVHNWGGIFFFKNGEAVTERVWKLETER